VRSDLRRHYTRSKRGRPTVPIEVTLRLVVLRRSKQWPYRQIEQEERDTPAYRGWVRVYDQNVPDHSTLNDLEHLIRVSTQHRINERLLVMAQSQHLTKGKKLRLDASVTDTNVCYPTDSGLLVDSVRLLSHWLNAPHLCCPRKSWEEACAVTECAVRSAVPDGSDSRAGPRPSRNATDRPGREPSPTCTGN
jgi:hypothetical protein